MTPKETLEMYLKAILQLEDRTEGLVKPIDVSKYLNISKPSVSEMLKKLDSQGYIRYESYKDIKLTPKGLKEAKRVNHKYLVIKSFLTDVLEVEVDDKKVHNEACKLEHEFSDKTIEILAKKLPELKKLGAPKHL